jgi:general secretion pathway protein A
LGTNYFKSAPPDESVMVAPPSVAESVPDSLEWVKALSLADSENLAYQSLFRAWGVTYLPDVGGNPTDLAAEHGLALLAQHGNFSSIRRLNRPVVLRLTGNQGEDFYAALTVLDDEMATLWVGTEQRTVAIRDLVRQWFGDFILLWQPPPGYSGVILPAERGPVVQWLARQMDVLHGRQVLSAAAPTYTGQLLQEVQNFQFVEGLEADGLVGPLTLIHLYSRIDSGQPQLVAWQKE